MVYLFGVLALGLLIAAAVNYPRDKPAAIFFVCCAALNLGALAMTLAKDGDEAWRLQPQQETVEPAGI